MNESENPLVVLTGVTGTVGRELVVRMVKTAGLRIACLVRAGSDEEANARISETLSLMPHQALTPEERSRITGLRGDITQLNLGLAQDTWDRLAVGVTRIVHGAANVSWSLPIEEARRINTGGTKEVLRLARAAAKHGNLQAFDYLSTVMVAGRREGLIPEEELDESAGFWSTYEQSKCGVGARVWAPAQRCRCRFFA